MRRAWLVAGLATGCFSPRVQEGAPCTSSAQCPTGQVCNPNLRCERVAFDAGSPLDGALPDGAPPDACTSCPVVVARYSFDGDLGDAGELHPAKAMGNGLTFVPGALGQAVKLPATGPTHVLVADSPAFDLPAGKIELRFRFGASAPAGELGLLSRDARNTATDGHFSLRIGADRRVVARIQRMSSPTVQAYRCTKDPVAADAWHRVEVSFGPAGLALTVDGAAAGGASWTDSDGTAHSCTTPWDRGIAGNDNPLVLGALTVLSDEGTGDPVSAVANTVELDEVVVSALP